MLYTSHATDYIQAAQLVETRERLQQREVLPFFAPRRGIGFSLQVLNLATEELKGLLLNKLDLT